MDSQTRVSIQRTEGKSIRELISDLNNAYPTESDIVGLHFGMKFNDQDVPKNFQTPITFCSSTLFNSAINLTVNCNNTQDQYCLEGSATFENLAIIASQRYGKYHKYTSFSINGKKIFKNCYLIELESFDLSLTFDSFNSAVDKFYYECMQATPNNYDIVSDMFAHNYLLYYFPMECIIRRLLVKLGELSIREVLDFEAYKQILKLPTLQSEDGCLPDINFIFKRCFFDAIMRPLYFKDLAKLSYIQDLDGFRQLTIKYTHVSISMCSFDIQDNLGELSEFVIDEETLNLARAILLSKPSQRVMASMHDDPITSIAHMIQQYIRMWKGFEGKMFKWRHEKQVELWEALSGYNGIIFIHENLLTKSLFHKAYVLSHEMQHLLERQEDITYSPLNYIKKDKMIDFSSISFAAISFLERDLPLIAFEGSYLTITENFPINFV